MESLKELGVPEDSSPVPSSSANPPSLLGLERPESICINGVTLLLFTKVMNFRL